MRRIAILGLSLLLLVTTAVPVNASDTESRPGLSNVNGAIGKLGAIADKLSNAGGLLGKSLDKFGNQDGGVLGKLGAIENKLDEAGGLLGKSLDKFGNQAGGVLGKLGAVANKLSEAGGLLSKSVGKFDASANGTISKLLAISAKAQAMIDLVEANPGAPDDPVYALARTQVIINAQAIVDLIEAFLESPPVPPAVDGAVGQINAIAFELDVMHGHINGILAGLPPPDPEHPPDPGITAALREVRAEAQAIVDLVEINLGPLTTEIDEFHAALIRVLGNAQAIIDLIDVALGELPLG